MWNALAIAAAVVLVVLGASLYAQAELPSVTGPYAVGRTQLLWTDDERPEIATAETGDRREVPVDIWYPAVTGTGEPAPYFPGLDDIRDGLKESGEVAAIELFGLPFIRSDERINAELAGNPALFPLVIFSPGNGTNVEFYAALAGDLASNGYVVVGINHPYDVAATRLSDGSIAIFNSGPDQYRPEHVASRVAERAKDISFVLDRLAAMAATGGELAARLDFGRVAALGHSLGGIAAAKACAADDRFSACGNFDGLQAGGPFAVIDRETGPAAAFLFMTKEPELSPALRRLFEEREAKTYAVRVENAEHDAFTDAPLLRPSILPFPGQADRNIDLIRRTTLTFLEAELAGRLAPLVDEAGLEVTEFGDRGV